MKIYVDMDKCQHYGQCTFEAPTVFALNDDGKLEYVGDVDDALADLEIAHAVAARDQLHRGLVRFNHGEGITSDECVAYGNVPFGD